MKEIGGYFELELPKVGKNYIHADCVMVNSGRHALEFILRNLGEEIKKIYVPYYTCDVVLQPIIKLGLNYEFYHIDQNLEIETFPNLIKGEYIIVNNYFGIKDAYINQVASVYGPQMIVDNAQAWYAPYLQGISAFYSPRKFFGLPDGGCAYTNNNGKISYENDFSYDRCSHLLKRIDINAGAGYDDFHENSAIIKNLPLRWMSKLTNRLLSSIDFDRVKNRRVSNYKYLDTRLGHLNLFKAPSLESFACPMIYPYLTENVNLRGHLIKNKIFVAKYWPNVTDWCKEGSTEYKLTNYLIPLPVDQRYSAEDMEFIIRTILDGCENSASAD